MEDFQSEGCGFESVSGSLLFVDVIFLVCFSRAFFATALGLCSCVCLAGKKNGNPVF